MKVICDAMTMASLPVKGFIPSSTNDFLIPEHKGPNYPGPLRTIFSVQPGFAKITYWMPGSAHIWEEGIPDDASIEKRAWNAAAQLGLDTNQLVRKNLTSRFCDADEAGNRITNHLCGRGVFLSRRLDGVLFFGTGDRGDGEGFWLELGSSGRIQAYSLTWPKLQRHELSQTASPEQIITCIRSRRVIVFPHDNEEDYFSRLKHLATVKSLTITKVTPYYGEGVFGEPPKDGPSEFVTPCVELDAIADLGNSNATLRIYSPILSTDVKRLLKTKSP